MGFMNNKLYLREIDVSCKTIIKSLFSRASGSGINRQVIQRSKASLTTFKEGVWGKDVKRPTDGAKGALTFGSPNLDDHNRHPPKSNNISRKRDSRCGYIRFGGSGNHVSIISCSNNNNKITRHCTNTIEPHSISNF